MRVHSTLSIDCGGLGLKASVLDDNGTMHAQPIRIPTPYPFSPTRFVEAMAELAGSLPRADRITIGMPGMLRHGVVVATPHYVTRFGPLTRVDPDLLAAWSGHDVRAALEERFKVPVLVLNDAEVHAAGVIAGTGLELVLTLGTGLGSAVFDGGRLAPHLTPGRYPDSETALNTISPLNRPPPLAGTAPGTALSNKLRRPRT